AHPPRPALPTNSYAAMFGFDLQHTHFNPAEHILNAANVSHLVSYWTVPTKSYVISSPAVAQGIVYIGSYDRILYACDARTGKIIWTYTTGDAIWSSPTVANGVVYVGSNDNNLYAFNALTGAVLWT